MEHRRGHHVQSLTIGERLGRLHPHEIEGRRQLTHGHVLEGGIHLWGTVEHWSGHLRVSIVICCHGRRGKGVRARGGGARRNGGGGIGRGESRIRHDQLCCLVDFFVSHLFFNSDVFLFDGFAEFFWIAMGLKVKTELRRMGNTFLKCCIMLFFIEKDFLQPGKTHGTILLRVLLFLLSKY